MRLRICVLIAFFVCVDVFGYDLIKDEIKSIDVCYTIIDSGDRGPKKGCYTLTDWEVQEFIYHFQSAEWDKPEYRIASALYIIYEVEITLISGEIKKITVANTNYIIDDKRRRKQIDGIYHFMNELTLRNDLYTLIGDNK